GLAAGLGGNTLISAGMGGLGSLESGQSVDWAKWGAGTGIGAATGLVTGGIGAGLGVASNAAVGWAGRALGVAAARTTWVGANVVNGALTAGAGSVTSQWLSKGKVDWRSVGLSMLGGAFGGAVTAGLTRNMIHMRGDY